MQNLIELFKQYYIWYFGIGVLFAIAHWYELQKIIIRRNKFDSFRTHSITIKGYLFTALRISFYPIFILNGIIKFFAKL